MVKKNGLPLALECERIVTKKTRSIKNTTSSKSP